MNLFLFSESLSVLDFVNNIHHSDQTLKLEATEDKPWKRGKLFCEISGKQGQSNEDIPTEQYILQ